MTKISALTALTGAGVDTANDLMAIVDVSVAGASGNKKITVAELINAFNVPELARDALGTALVAGANVTITPNDGTDTITIAAATGGAIEVLDEGVSETALLVSLDFTGTGVSASDDGSGNVTVTIPGGISTFAIGDATDVDTTGEAAGNLLRFNGTNWVPSSLYEAGPPTPPTTADLATWDNQGTSTATDGTNALILKPQVDAVLHGRYKAAPSTPYDVYCRVEINTFATTLTGTAIELVAGILFKDTGGDNERLVFGIYQRHDTSGGDDTKIYAAVCSRWSGASPPVFSANGIIKYGLTPWKWLRVNNDGTTLTFYVSFDGRNWHQAGTETLAAHIDGAASYGVGAYGLSTDVEAVTQFTYFSTTAPS